MLAPHHRVLLGHAEKIAAQYTEYQLQALLRAPVIILSAPRSGSTLLFEVLQKSQQFWSIGNESHIIYNSFPELHPRQRQFSSGALKSEDATPELCHMMRACFLALLRNSSGQRWLDLPPHLRPEHPTLLEKTPRNALNMPFIQKLFPGYRVIFLHRSPYQTIASIMEAWETGHQFVTFRNLPGWDRGDWCLLLPPGWRNLNGKSLAEIAVFQWIAANNAILKNLEQIERLRWTNITYNSLVASPLEALNHIAQFAGISLDKTLETHASGSLPLSRTTISPPSNDKWLRHKDEIEALSKYFQPLSQQLERITVI